MRTGRLRALATIVLVGTAASGACHDWSMPEEPDSGATPDSGEPPDAASDADCAEQAGTFAQYRLAAKMCESPLSVCTTIEDECGCTAGVSGAAGVATVYVAAVQQFKNAGCQATGCPSSCPAPQEGYCAIGSYGYTCLP